MTKKISSFFLVSTLLWAWSTPTMAQEAELYSIPLRYDVIGDGVTQLPLELDYDLTSQSELRLGDIIIGAKSFQIKVGTLDEINALAAPYAGEEERRSVALLIKWPLPLIPEGYVEAIGQSGRVLWQTEILKADVEAWAAVTGEMRARMQGNVKSEELDANPILSSVWIFRDFLNRAPELIETQENFRLCIARQTARGQSRLCSTYMGLKEKNRKWVVEDIPQPEKPARIISFQKQSPLKSRRRIKTKGPVQFLAELSNGFIYEFVSRPPRVEIVELVKGDKENVKIVGFGQEPSNPHRVLNPIEESFIVRTFKWQETIGDFRLFWEVDVPKETTTLYFPGPSGGLFKQVFDIKRLPRESSRPFVDYRTPDSTYIDGAKIFGMRANDTSLSSDESSVSPVGDRQDLFLWYFKAEKRGDLNRSHLGVQDGDQIFKAYFEMFKGYPRELSFRSSAVLGSGGKLLLNAEAAFNYWFEDLLTWSDATLSRQRWGVSAKYFQSATPVQISNTIAPMKTLTFDLKYRLRPGLWGRDESWGLLLGLNDFGYDIFQTKMLGLGFFWARSMPRLFDDFMNKFPFMQYPKWVDLEFIYYPVLISSPGMSLNGLPVYSGNWALNFHGKVMWTKSFFGEAGFGVRNVDMNREVSSTLFVRRLRFQFASVYTTVGIGYQF